MCLSNPGDISDLMDKLFLLHGTKSICQGSKGLTQQRTVTHQTELDI